MFGVPRSSMYRHASHVPPADRPVIVPPPPPEDPRVDPLAAAFGLLEQAKTERQQLKALEQVRAATWLRVRELTEPDEETLEQLEANITAAEEMFRGTEGFEQAIRALQGVREAVGQRLRAVRQAETISYSYVIVSSRLNEDGSVTETGRSEPIEVELSAAAYWRGVPSRYRDATRYRVERDIQLQLDAPGLETITVREGDAIAWNTERRHR